MKPTLSADLQALHGIAATAMRHSYSPYSKFRVGAALRTKDGRVFSGSNIENVSLGLTICAERAALAKAVSEGESEFDAIAVACDAGAGCPPCGACRQVLFEFSEDLMIVYQDESEGLVVTTIAQLLPNAFGPRRHRRDGQK